MDETIKKQLKVKLLISVVILVIVSLFYGLNSTGEVIVAPKTEGTCSYGGATYDGSFMKVLSPENNSYSGKNNFNLTILSDYYGSDIVTKCEGEEESNCSLKISSVMYSTYLLGGEERINKTIDIPSFTMPKTNEGNKTYSYTALSSNENYTTGNFTVKTAVKYSCQAEELQTQEMRIFVHLENPTIIEIYPTNNLKINISENATTTIFPKLIATDTLGILNKTVYDGSNIINLVSSPNYNVTLSPGTYTWNFTTTDLAGNIAFVVSQFAIFNSSTNMTTNETNVTEETTTNATISFDSSTATDNDLTNQSSVSIKINANTNKSTVNLTLNIFDSAGRVVYKNSTTEKTIDVFHTFVSDGDYYYNATLISGEETINTPTRKITIDTESPTITIISPTKTKNNFTNYAVIDFSADDTNGIARRWINDGTKDTTYTSRINKSLTEGSYSWTVFAQDDAGNIAEEIIKFSIVSETAKKPNKNIAIFVIIIAAILIIVLIAWYFLKKKPEQPSTPNQTFGSLPPANPSLQFNRPLPPRSPPFLRPTPMPMNPAMFKNNPVQQ